MSTQLTLRHRITLTFVLFSSLLSIIIAAGVLYVIEDIEDEFIFQSMRAEQQYVLQQNNLLPDTQRQVARDAHMIYVAQQSGILPAALQGMDEGFHGWQENGKSLYVLIDRYQLGQVYLIKDATEFEHREIAIRWSLLALVLSCIALGVWLGRAVAGKVISPVAKLAGHVAQLTPGSTGETHIALDYAHDEVGQLARTFDLYLLKIQQYIKREQDFTADASHELRTPLAVIQSAAELLQTSPRLDEREQKQLQRIIRASERMSQMLEILLLLARELPSQPPLNVDSCSAQEVVQEVMEQHRFLLKTGVNLHDEIGSDFAIAASRNVLSIVLSNLIKNAIQHTEQGEIVVQVQNQKISIRDTGRGIPPEEVQHIFARFYRGKNSQGSGIGLSLVKRICDRQGWQIQLNSQPGQGTEVVITF